MNSDKGTKTGGASITPSARPSIHSHGGCVYLRGENKNMGKYGLPKNKDEHVDNVQNNATEDLGRDEVDNIQSKLARTPSPFSRPITQKDCNKRKSFDDGIIHRDDSDSSDDVGNWSSPLNTSPNSSHNSRSFYGNDTSAGSIFESMHGTPRRNNFTHTQSTRPEPKSNQPKVLLMGFLGLMVAAMVSVQNGSLPSSLPEVFKVSETYNTAKFYDDLNSLGGKYKITDDTILQLKQGVSTIFKRQDTGSFVLAYKSSDRDFDHDRFNNLVNTIAGATSKYLRNDSTSVQHIVVDGSKLEMDSHSELISKYRDDVSRTGVMLVRELDEVPSALAMAFHYYCDEYNPLVKRSAIFFTLDMAKCSHNPAEQQPTHARIEKCLKEKWNGVPKDNLSPLLNRVVSIVINVSGV